MLGLTRTKDKIKIDFDKSEITVKSLCTLAELHDFFMLRAGNEVALQMPIDSKRVFGNVYFLPHTFSKNLIERGCSPMKRMILEPGWVIYGYNNIFDAVVHTNEITMPDGQTYSHLVLEFDEPEKSA